MLVVRTVKHLALAVGWLVFLPATLLLHIVGYRRLTVFVDRIGHLAAEPDCFLKKKALDELPAGRRWFMLAPPKRVANLHLLSYWRPHIVTFSHPLPCLILGVMSRWFFLRLDISDYVLQLDRSQEYFRVCSDWGNRPPILTLTPDDKSWSNSAFQALGLPQNVWFVCVHVREPGFSPIDERLHAHRNGAISAAIPAMQEIVKRGGWCVRMGDPTMTPLPPIEGVIDYAHHSLRSDRLDVTLCARARFFLGNTSGLAFVSTIFGVSCALANMIPTSARAPLSDDLSIPKILWLEREGRYLKFSEILHSPLGNCRFAKRFLDAGVRVDENSAEEILELVKEMLDRLDGTFVEKEEDRVRQAQYLGLFRPNHYSYWARSRVAAAFLRQHRDLLNPS